EPRLVSPSLNCNFWYIAPGASTMASARRRSIRMKLPRPFYRLPVRFDFARLRGEVDGFGPDEWHRHPSGYAGNTAIRLISAHGGENDRVGGPMKPTEALGR